jgi:hypothetical protein
LLNLKLRKNPKNLLSLQTICFNALICILSKTLSRIFHIQRKGRPMVTHLLSILRQKGLSFGLNGSTAISTNLWLGRYYSVPQSLPWRLSVTSIKLV